MQFTANRLSIVLLAAAGMCFATPANADWISDKLSDSCSGASSSALSQSVRDNIEDSMKRAEAAIKPPSPVGDLGCLEDLMGDVGINIFSAEQGGDFGGSMASGVVQQLMGSLGDQLGGAGLGDLLDAGGDPMGAICKFAEEKWGELSGSLGMGDMKLPPDLKDVMNLGNFNLPGGNGSGSGARQSPLSAPDPSPSPIATPPDATAPGTEDAISQLWREMAAPTN